MAINSIYGSITEKNRISGIASGLDSDELVKSMASAYYKRVTSAYQDKVKMEYKKDAYLNFSNSLSDFTGKFLSVVGSNSIKAKSTFSSLTVNTRGSVESANVKISARNGAELGNHTLQVLAVAKGARLDSSVKIGGNVQSDQLLSSFSGLSNLENEDITITFYNSSIGKNIDVTVNKSDTLSSLAKKMNSMDLGVKLNVSEISGLVSLEGVQTGENAIFDFQASASFDNGQSVDFFESLGFDFNNYASSSNYHKGRDAEIVIDGYTKTSSSNSFLLDGIDIEVISTTNNPFTFSVEASTEKAKENILSFVEGLNTVLETIYKNVNEKPMRNYLPLTDEQKSEMKDSEIELWETQAKKGTMYNDSKLRSLITDIRRAIITPVDGVQSTLADIGISMDKYSEGTAPKIIVDEEKLSRALSENPLAVEQLFTNSAAGGTFQQQGVAARLQDSISNYNNVIRKLEYNTVGFNKKISALETKLLEETKRLEKKQTEFYSKIAKMEAALATMQSQNNWLSQYTVS